MRSLVTPLLLALAGCATTHRPVAPIATVTAKAETVPVGTANADAADDPAIWRNADDPEASLIVATDKKAGLYVYGLDGKVRHFSPSGQLNNVDLIDRGADGILVVGSDRNDLANARLQFYQLDRVSGSLKALGSVPGGAGEAYGICLWQDQSALYAFSVLKDGNVHQVRIAFAGAQPNGTIVRSLRLATQTEGCVVDPRSASLFVGEEDRGIWRFDAQPTGSVQGELVARVDGKQLVADVEGLAIDPSQADGGFLIASSQGDNSYVLYRLPDMTPAGRFRVGSGTYGSTEETDGIAFHPGSFGERFPAGLFVVQDGVNAPAAQNFKLVSWQEVLSATGAGSAP